jgi:D-alanine transaminase
MSDQPGVAWINGELVPWAEARLPLEDRGLQFGESLYEVVPITAGRARLLVEHAARMRRSAEILELHDGVPPDASWNAIAERLIEHERLDEGVLYVQLTGGVAPRDHARRAARPNLVAYVRPRRFPRAADAERGVRAISLPDTRWANCQLKTTMLLPAVLARREAALQGAHEAILIGEHGNVREGTSSSVIVVEGRRLVRPLGTHHVLPGVTSPLVARIATRAGYDVIEATVPRKRLDAADELLLMSTSRLVLGVTHLDGQPIGAGRPGPAALELAALLRRFFELD